MMPAYCADWFPDEKIIDFIILKNLMCCSIKKENSSV